MSHKIKSKRMRVSGDWEAYFTVEACFIFPLVLGIVLFVIYLWFFQYNRCVVNQDAGAIVVSICGHQDKGQSKKQEYGKERIRRIYKDAYVDWVWGESSLQISGKKVVVVLGGKTEFPFGELNFWNEDNVWETQVEHSGRCYSPMLLTRTFRKIKGMF